MKSKFWKNVFFYGASFFLGYAIPIVWFTSKVSILQFVLGLTLPFMWGILMAGDY
jgi:hypothetical protein